MRPIGSRVDTASGLAGVNFLSDATRRAVDHRLAKPQRQKFETLNETRLRCDLLSSMPMCFNLFGSMWADPALASEVTHRWFPGLCPVGADVEVLFECSPGRADPRWLDDRNAFDASLRIRTDGNVHLIGFETKYHEYPITEPAVRRHDGVEVRREMKQRYRDVSQHANLLSDTASIDQL